MAEFLVGPDNGHEYPEGTWKSYLTWYDDDFKPRVVEAKTPAAAARQYGKAYGVPEDGLVVQALQEPLSFTVSETTSVSVKPR